MTTDINFFVNIIEKKNNPINFIIGLKCTSISEKYHLINELSLMMKDLFIDPNITPKTIRLLLKFKSEDPDFINLFSFLIKKKPDVFTYDHLYHLVLQTWMDIHDTYISVNTRKNLISIGLGNSVNTKILENIKEEANNWFCNINKNSEITELIEWIGQIDASGQFIHYKMLYERQMEELDRNDKIFHKLSGITPIEFQHHYEKTKKNGLCKFIRENQICPYGLSCNFYHGKIEETYGIQPCKYGYKCSKRTCKFQHEATSKIIQNTKTLYESLFTNDKYLSLHSSNEHYIDDQILNNPYFILQKLGKNNDSIYYQLPKCCCPIRDEFGTFVTCNKPVRFMTKGPKKHKFYCCYEHMELCGDEARYVVKQNIIDKIFLN